ncbi:Annexin [Anaeromyces robustus]|uniref:Annexin n=1 Tax=Anaeromyces robustus TaxID=1754192 RepID=A0A1Y1XBA1_9FUNG|nr:Annexin [Anaeromyces robustus]|eukprot:ORX83030.1 Annexin [Anaeromyces robustus]
MYPGNCPRRGPPKGAPPSGTPQQGGFPPQGEFPPKGFPPQQGFGGGFPPQGGFPPPQQQGFPHQDFPPPCGFPPQQGGFPPPCGFPPPGGFPPQQGGFPPPGGFPPQQGGFPPPGGMLPQQGGFPPPGGFPPQQGGFPPPDGMAPQQGGFSQNGIQQTNITNPNPNCLLTPAQCDAAVQQLREAMKGFGTDEKNLIKVLGTYPPLQMNQIVKGYKSNFGKSLYDTVKSETSGDFGQLCCALCMTIAEYDVKCINKALEGTGTDDDCLMEILVGRTNSDIRFLREEYKRIYCREIEDDVKKDTSGYVRRLYTVLLQGNRDETNNARDAMADAETLYRAGEGKLGTDEMAFISLLCNRPDDHLRQVFDIYQQKHGHTFEKAISKEFSGDIKKALTNLVSSIRNKAEYIATLFEKSMKGIGTDDDMLIRLTVRHRAPNVIGPIKAAYQTKYGKSLAKRIKGETSGNYRKLLLTLIQEPDE